MKKKQMKWTKCGDKPRLSKKIILTALVLTITFSIGQSNIIGEMNVIGEEEIYRGGETEIRIKIDNLRSTTLENPRIEIESEPLQIDQKIETGDIRPGESFRREIKIETRRETQIGKHEVQGQMFYTGGTMKLEPVTIEVKETPLKLETTLEKESIAPGEENTLTLKLTNVKQQTLTDVEVEAKFQELTYINSKEECSRSYSEMPPGDSFETSCDFHASEDAGRKTELPIEASFHDEDGEKHHITQYKEIEVDTQILPGIKTFLIVGIAIIIFLMFLKAKVLG